jgi:hypothetical protein
VKPPKHPQKPSGGRNFGNKGHGAKPAAVREKAILALLTERTIGTAALRCGVNERTLRRWLTEDATFVADYDAARLATFQAGINRVQLLTAKAVDTLEKLLTAKKFPSVQLGAARTVMELALHQRDAEDILLQLDQIEAAQQLQQERDRQRGEL